MRTTGEEKNAQSESERRGEETAEVSCEGKKVSRKAKKEKN